MALGDTYQNNKKDYEKKNAPTLYSEYSFANSESKIDPTKLGISFWSGIMKVSIAVFDNNTKKYDYKNECTAYLSYFKARLFADEISLFLQNPEEYNNRGVDTKDTRIYISNGKEFTGELKPCLVIRKVDENGVPLATYVYEFKSDYHYSIIDYNEDGSYDKKYNQYLEVELFRQTLLDYSSSMNGATAYSILHYERFDNSKKHTKLDSIAKALGVEYGNKNNSTVRRNISSFSNQESRSFTTADLDDIENEM